MLAIILAAGYATRLYPLTQDKPKALLEVGGKSILQRLFEKFKDWSKLERTVLVTNHKFFNAFSDWQKNASYASRTKVIDDGTLSNETRLGACGDLLLAIERADTDEDILFFACDNVFDEGLEGFERFCALHSQDPCIVVHDIEDKSKAAGTYGVIQTGPDGRVQGFQEKPQNPLSSLIGVGVYYLPSRCVEDLREYMRMPDHKDAPGYFFDWLHQKTPIWAYTLKGPWYDIGDLKSLKEADLLFSRSQSKVK